MKDRRYMTFVIMPPTPGKRVISVSLPSLTVMGLLLAFGVLLSLASAGVWSFFHYQSVADKSLSLETENKLAKANLEEQKQRIDHLNRELLKIREKAGFIQNFLGLKPQGSAGGKIGQGGIEIAPRSLSFSQGAVYDSEAHTPPVPDMTLKDLVSSQDLNRLDTDLEQIVGNLRNRQDKLDRTPFLTPVDPNESWISSRFGTRISPFTGKPQFHPGIDIAGSEGTPIMAPAKGKVVFVDKNGLLGLSVKIIHDSTYETIYGHLQRTAVKKGQLVERGDVIGFMGSSGRSTGYHLHYQIKRNEKTVNPFEYMMDWQENKLLLASD